MTKLQKLVHYLKVALVNVLILVAVGSVIYAHSTKWVVDKEKEMQGKQIQALQQEIVELKK